MIKGCISKVSVDRTATRQNDGQQNIHSDSERAWTAFVLLVYLNNSLNIQALLVCPAMSGPASLTVIVHVLQFQSTQKKSRKQRMIASGKKNLPRDSILEEEEEQEEDYSVVYIATYDNNNNSCHGWSTRDHSPLSTPFHCHPAGKCSLFYEHIQIWVKAISNRNCLIFSLRLCASGRKIIIIIIIIIHTFI